MDLELSGKSVLITGGSIGIGLAVAHAFAGEGCDLLLCARNGKRLREASEIIASTYEVKVVPVEADVSKADDIDRVVSESETEYAGIDILINNAGTGSEETVLGSEDGKWQYYWDLHVMAAVRLARGCAPGMKRKGGGAIIHNASICAKQPLYYEPIYNVTKAALVMFSKCLANELIGDGIRVNTINPGLVMTPDWRKTATALGENEGKTADEILDGIACDYAPIKRFATPEEMADFFVFLASPRASYALGSTYFVDGGWLGTV